MAAAVLLTTAAVPCTAAVTCDVPGAACLQEPVRLLDVPYLPQSEALCGGAAAAMVMRYWAGGSVHADAFAHLVDQQAGGIRGDDLLRALHEQGWQATSFKGDEATVARHLADGRPIIALVEDRPDRFHYVVVVGWSGGRVIAHDPARAPFRVYRQDAFLNAWSKSGFWTLLATPGVAGTKSPGAPTVVPALARAGGGPCESMVTEGVRLAGVGDAEEARRLLELAVETCPADPAPRRELAGVYVLHREWDKAAGRAREALERDPSDTHAARILGTSLFLEDDVDGALAAWNLVGEPTIDLVNVIGLDRIRYEVIATLLGLQPRDLLTPDRLRRARRRLEELPGANLTRVTYVPRDGGRANVEAVLVERPLVPTGLAPLGVLAARSLIDREIRFTLASPTGGGEALEASWRWWVQRPRVSVSFSTPSPVPALGTVWRLEAFYDRQSYHDRVDVEEARRGASFGVMDWLSGRWRWELGIGLDRWRDLGASVGVNAALARHSADDRWAATLRGSLLGGAVDTGTASLRVDWRSDTRREGAVWHARAGLDLAGEDAPYALWPGAGTGHARDVLLRAHPLLEDGVIRSGVFGRRLAHGGVELRQWIRPTSRPWRIAPAAFADVARAGRTESGFDDRLHVDAGVGLLLGVPGGAVRIDVGRGLRDGAMAVSITTTRDP